MRSIRDVFLMLVCAVRALTMREGVSSFVAGVGISAFRGMPNFYVNTLVIGGVTQLRKTLLNVSCNDSDVSSILLIG